MHNAEIEAAIEAFGLATTILADCETGHSLIGVDTTEYVVERARTKVEKSKTELWAAIERALREREIRT